MLREHGLSLATGTISDLACVFAGYLGALHVARANRLRAALESDGGWPLHVLVLLRVKNLLTEAQQAKLAEIRRLLARDRGDAR